MIQLGVTLKSMYKFNATAHALSASVSIWQFLSKSKGGKTNEKTNLESPGHKIVYGKIKPRSFGIIHNLPSKPGLPFLPHSLIGWLDFTAGFLYPMNCSAVHHRVRKSSSATAITKVSKTG